MSLYIQDFVAAISFWSALVVKKIRLRWRLTASGYKTRSKSPSLSISPPSQAREYAPYDFPPPWRPRRFLGVWI